MWLNIIKRGVWIVSVLMIGCGHSNNIQISAPGIASGTVRVISVSTSEIIVEKTMNGGHLELSAAELGLSLQPIEIQIRDAVYVDFAKNKTRFRTSDYFSALVSSDFSGETIHVNPLTTLASCRLKKTIQVKDTIDLQIKKENGLIAAQFKIPDLQTIDPATDFSKMDQLTASALYGILLGGFEQLAIDQEVGVPVLVEMLCSDVGFDSMFNGVGKEGVILNHGLFDEQVLKAKYASAIYNFSQQHMVNFAKLPMGAFANEISLSLQVPLFSPGILNNSFDH